MNTQDSNDKNYIRLAQLTNKGQNALGRMGYSGLNVDKISDEKAATIVKKLAAELYETITQEAKR